MEQVHGIDTSWVHKPTKQSRKHAASVPSPRRDVRPPATPDNSRAPAEAPPSLSSPPTASESNQDSVKKEQVTTNTQAGSSAAPTTPNAAPSTPTATANGRTQGRRPSLLQRSSSEKPASDGRGLSRKSSWLNNIGSKFSSSTPERPSATQAQQPKPALTSAAASTTNLPVGPSAKEPAEEIEPYVPSKPKDQSSFFSSLTRRFSSSSQVGGSTRVHPNGGVCARRVLNLDPNRERCILTDMEPSKLRKVSFCVDVEVAGGPTYKDEADEQERSRRKKEFKIKERAEGEALKHPEAQKEEKENDGNVALEAQAQDLHKDQPARSPAKPVSGAIDVEKKKKTDEERRERLEKRKRRAEENGSIPLEMSMIDDEADPTMGVSVSPSTPGGPDQATAAVAARMGKMDRPTTDPVRIYRRCCQLRETPILKRITEQLMSPTCTAPFEPGIVNCLDLTHSRLQLADVVTLGDWLAVVPVKHLKLEDADINDEGVRCILAGLLAAKRPEPSRRRLAQPRHRQHYESPRYQERSGVIEKITFKNNPRITRIGFKHISLFLYLCRSIKAVDLSMNVFPETVPASTTSTPVKSQHHHLAQSGSTDLDAARIFHKCLAERLGGSTLEELVLSECRLDSEQIRKVVDSAAMCGVKRLGLAGNNIDAAGLEHVIRYIQSGVCNAIDIGSNDLRDKLDMLAQAIETKPDVPLWGLSLAGCNLESASLKSLFPALVRLPDFRFIDLSHNRDLCKDNGTISLFRRFLGQMTNLKRVHLADVGMSPMQAIALADALPEGPRLAHLNILENKQLTALAHARSEADQEEACALYASLMAAVRVSSTIICIDIDVPSAENNEIVKALAKQVVAYSLRNMEQFAIAEATGVQTADATAKLTEGHGGERGVREMTVPDVLMHLVGHIEGVPDNHNDDEPAPDEDYIVGGTGVVKALQYVLGEKANDLRRTSMPSTPMGGSITPRERPGSSVGLEEQRGKAKMMSKDLLEAARKIRARLQPALLKEAGSGDEMAYRRLLFLDTTLQNMIQRFEEEYPETRKGPPVGQSPVIAPSATSSLDTLSNTELSINTVLTDANTAASESDEEDGVIRSAMSRRNSDVSLASRALSEEEGRLHRHGQKVRRAVIAVDYTGPVGDDNVPKKAGEDERIRVLTAKLEALSGTEVRTLVETGGWPKVLERVGGNYDDLRKMWESDPQGWEEFKESQLKARMNLDREKGEQAVPPAP